MKKMLLLLVPLVLLLIACQETNTSSDRQPFQPIATATSVPAWDTVKYVEYSCSRSSTTLRGQRALDLCPASRIKMTVGILTPQGTIYELDVSASDYSPGSPNIRGNQLIGLLPEVGDLWTGQPELKAAITVTLSPTPVVTVAATATAALSKAPANSPRPEFHIVVVGDSLMKISQFYGLTFAQLRALNPDVDGDVLWVGQVLRVTGNQPPETTTATATVAVATPTVEATVILPFRAWGQGIAPGRNIKVRAGGADCDETYADNSGNWYIELENGCRPDYRYAPDLKAGDWLEFSIEWLDMANSTYGRLQGAVRYEPGANVEVIMRD